MRDDFSAEVKRTVANRVNSICSNPDCRAVTSGPQTDPSKSVNVGVAAHITAASKGGARYDETLSSASRSHAVNAIWLCQTCAKWIDNDVPRFPKKLLLNWKSSAEHTALSSLGKAASHVDAGSGNILPEEIDILCAAAEKGEIHLIEVNELHPWVMVNNVSFSDDSDPANAAAYLEALESLLRRRLVRHEGGILYVLTGTGFKVARSLNQARLDAQEVASEEVIDQDVAKRAKLSPGMHVSYDFNLTENEGLDYEIDGTDALDVFIASPTEYAKWRNKENLPSFDELYRSKSYIKDEFWPDEDGEYIFVVANQGQEKVKADVRITVLEEVE